MAAVVGGAPPADGAVLQGGLLEHGARLGEQRLLMRRRDDGALVTLDRRLLRERLQLGAVRLGDQLRVRGLVLVLDQLLVAGGGHSRACVVGPGLRGAGQRGGRRRRQRRRGRERGHGKGRGPRGVGRDHGDGDDGDGHGRGRQRARRRRQVTLGAELLPSGDMFDVVCCEFIEHARVLLLRQLLQALLFLQFIFCENNRKAVLNNSFLLVTHDRSTGPLLQLTNISLHILHQHGYRPADPIKCDT